VRRQKDGEQKQKANIISGTETLKWVTVSSCVEGEGRKDKVGEQRSGAVIVGMGREENASTNSRRTLAADCLVK